MDGVIRLPLKVVLPDSRDIQQDHSTGGSRKIFGEVTPAVRAALIENLRDVSEFFREIFRETPEVPSVAKVSLKEEALAKSHRPKELLTSSTCPIIGVQGLGDLLVSVTQAGITRLAKEIHTADTKVALANISAISRIEPYTIRDVLPERNESGIKKLVDGQELAIKLKLFNHGDSAANAAILNSLLSTLADMGLAEKAREVHYSPALRLFRIQVETPHQVERLATLVGTQKLALFPRYRLVQTTSIPHRGLMPEELPPPSSHHSYPIIGVVDTGVNPEDVFLQPWTVARESYVPSEEADFRHGSFVAGLAIHSRRLNHGDSRFPLTSAKILDVAAVPKGGGISEDELVAVLQEVVPRYSEVKVWNLSLGTDEQCTDETFSDLAVVLDELQDRHGVIFVMAAGNYAQPPLRGWPPEDLGESDRICSPADSVRGIVVGSLAHRESPSSRVRMGCPSPFSRRGPGPLFLPKPDLSHYGGNCDHLGNCVQSGVLSTDGLGNLAEDIGTSFAAPVVTSLLANVQSSLRRPASRSLLKGLVVHSAAVGLERIDAQGLRYRGFGVPSDVEGVLSCDPWSITIIFETEIRPRLDFVKDPFPIPECLRTPEGKVLGEIIMTLAYEPPLDPRAGVEYCRVNVEASLGTYDENKDGKRTHKRQVPPEPRDVRLLYERNLVEHGFKWSPIKVYKRRMKRPVMGRRWRLIASALYRSGFVSEEPQHFSLLVTLRDPEKRRPVYDETVRAMQLSGWSLQDLEVRARLRPR